MTYDNSDLPISAASCTHAVKTDVGFMQDSERGARLPITADYTMSYRKSSELLVCTVYITVSLNCFLHDKLSQRPQNPTKITYIYVATCSARPFSHNNRDQKLRFQPSTR